MRPDPADRRTHTLRAGARAKAIPAPAKGGGHILGTMLAISGLLLIWVALVAM